jgi:hypothetical protein
MLNPQQLAETIDSFIACNRSHERPLDFGRVTKDILSGLPLDDRRGIDPDMLKLIVTARGMRSGASGIEGRMD